MPNSFKSWAILLRLNIFGSSNLGNANGNLAKAAFSSGETVLFVTFEIYKDAIRRDEDPVEAIVTFVSIGRAWRAVL